MKTNGVFPLYAGERRGRESSSDPNSQPEVPATTDRGTSVDQAIQGLGPPGIATYFCQQICDGSHSIRFVDILDYHYCGFALADEAEHAGDGHGT